MESEPKPKYKLYFYSTDNGPTLYLMRQLDNTRDAWTNSEFLLSMGIPIGGSDDVEEVD